jgi:hypothetical protein
VDEACVPSAANIVRWPQANEVGMVMPVATSRTGCPVGEVGLLTAIADPARTPLATIEAANDAAMR